MFLSLWPVQVKKNLLDLPQPPSSHLHSMPFLRQLPHMCFSGAFPFPYPKITLTNTLRASCSQVIFAATLHCNSCSSCLHHAANTSAFFLFSSSAQTLSASFWACSPSSAFFHASSASTSFQAFSASTTFQASSSCYLCCSSFACLAFSIVASCSWMHMSSLSDIKMVWGLPDMLVGMEKMFIFTHEGVMQFGQASLHHHLFWPCCHLPQSCAWPHGLDL